MKKAKKAPVDPELRRRAEERLRQEGEEVAPLSEADARRLVHELEVHQIELEMQNEELRAARMETEAGLARYTELFDFAPIGYATLTPGATIREINHTGARLLGMERGRIVGTKLSDFVAVDQRAALSALLERVQDSEGRESCEVELPRTGGTRPCFRLSATTLAHPEARCCATPSRPSATACSCSRAWSPGASRRARPRPSSSAR